MSYGYLRQLTDHVYFVRGEANGKFPYCHGLLITGSENVLIDAGVGESPIREADGAFGIDTVLITHPHPDHIRYLDLLEDRNILVPQETPESVTDLRLLGKRFTGNAEDGAHWAEWASAGLGVKPMRAADGRFGNGEVLDLGDAQLEAIHAPGHLNDHYCFLERKSGTLFTTDIALTKFGPWYGNPESDIDRFKKSVIAMMKTPYERVCTSHREPVEGDATDLFEAFLSVFDRHEQLVLELCTPPRSIDELVALSPIYRDAMANKFLQRVFETRMVSKNMAGLVKEGAVVESGGKYSRT